MWSKKIDWLAEFDRIGVRQVGQVFKMASGKYSDVKYDIDYLFRDPDLYYRACRDLLKKASRTVVPRNTWIIAPERGGISFAFELARQSGARAGYTVKKDSRFELAPCFRPAQHEQVILGDDVITTGGSVKKTYDTIRLQGSMLFGPILCFVNRSTFPLLCMNPEAGPCPYYYDVEIVSLVETNEPGWDIKDPKIPAHILKQIVTT